MMIIEWKSILFVAIMLVFILILIKLIDKKFKLDGEVKRKIFHVSMGLIMLTFPYIFSYSLSVGILGIIAIIFLYLLKNTKLKEILGTALYSVERESMGEIFFAISVFIVFYLSNGI